MLSFDVVWNISNGEYAISNYRAFSSKETR